MKCELCKKEVEKNNLDKIKGTYIYQTKNGKKKEYVICSECQKEYDNSKDLMLDMIEDK
ncbi:MAG: hypothetical protein ACOCRX_11155 [Candidatus Woesearchaeota archaeon]